MKGFLIQEYRGGRARDEVEISRDYVRFKKMFLPNYEIYFSVLQPNYEI
jgi:hypothetical protein